MDIEKIFEETDFPINDKVLASADFGDLSSELDDPFDGVLRGTFSCDKCDSVFTHRRSLEKTSNFNSHHFSLILLQNMQKEIQSKR
ncbi:hypothetical protein TNCV_4348471 [Trichonephila clavipes]|nr:hypothetical protein TNCV_4348471 [Trichonephila clavipes]